MITLILLPTNKQTAPFVKILNICFLGDYVDTNPLKQFFNSSIQYYRESKQIYPRSGFIRTTHNIELVWPKIVFEYSFIYVSLNTGYLFTSKNIVSILAKKNSWKSVMKLQ